MFDFVAWSIWANLAIFSASAAVVWSVGTRLVRLVDRLATQTGIGHAFAGMLLLGGMVSLTEIATVSTSAVTGSPALALNNLLGSISINIFLLAAVDPLSGRKALTSFIAKPVMMFQGTLVILLVALVSVAITTGDYPIGGIGIWSSAIFILCLFALWLSFKYEKQNVWKVSAELRRGDIDQKARRKKKSSSGAKTAESLRVLIFKIVVAGIILFSAGFLLSLVGDAIADQTGLGESFIGLVLVGISTSLPELSSIVAALRIGRYEMAVGDILGSNLFNVLLIFLVEVVYRGEPVLNQVGRFEVVASLLGVLMTAVLLLGLLERKDKTILKMGYDSCAIVAIFLGGVVLLFFLSEA